LLGELNEMDLSLVALLVSIFLAILASVFGTKYYYVKGKANQLNALIAEVTKAWEDDTITQEELSKILKLIKQLVTK